MHVRAIRDVSAMRFGSATHTQVRGLSVKLASAGAAWTVAVDRGA
jgi:hypothetical protein